MSDGLSTLSTESLTAAVTSLLHKPLPDINVHTPKAQGDGLPAPAVPLRHDVHPPNTPHQQIFNNPVTVQIQCESNVSPSGNNTESTISYLLNKPAETHSNTGTSELRFENASSNKKLKFSVENLHLATSTSDTVTSQSPGVYDKPSDGCSNSLSTLQSISTLLNSHPFNNPANNINSAPDTIRNPQNAFLPAAQGLPIQPLQQLIQSLFPQSDLTVQSHPHSTAFPAVNVSLDSGMIVASNAIEQKLASPVYVTSHQPLLAQRPSVQQSLSDGDGIQVLSTEQALPSLQHAPATAQQIPPLLQQASLSGEDHQNMTKGNPLQQFPFLVQSSPQGGPIQLIPIGATLDLPLIQMLQKPNTKTTAASPGEEGNPVSTQVTIQPKPPVLNLQALLNQINTSSTGCTQPAPAVLDINLLQNLLNSHLTNKSPDLRPPVPQPPLFPVSDHVPATPTSAQASEPTTFNVGLTASSEIPDPGTIEPCPSPPSLSTMAATSHTASMSTALQVPAHSVEMSTTQSYHAAPQEDEEIHEESHLESSHKEEEKTQVPDYHDNTVAVTTDVPSEVDQHRIQIFCTVCNKLYPNGCEVHGTDYVYIQDEPVLSRARASLPKCFCLQQTTTSDLKDFLGVWCKEYISERTLFGPVVGERKKIAASDYKQQTEGFNPYRISVTDGHCEVLCLCDESVCNWTMFVRAAHSLMEQNCVLYRDRDNFCLITTTEVKEEEELLMWFSADLCEQLGISQDPENTKLFQCGQCGKYFTSKKLQTSHLRISHPDFYRLNWTCPMCGKKFSSNSKLNSHMMLHMGLKPYTCSYCNKQFSDHSNLKTHVLIHTGQKKYKCETCGKTFRQKAHLEVHYIVHTGTKKYKCSFCSKPFARQADLKTHTYRHTQEMSYTCTTCGKKFYKTQNYKKHLKVHTGERNYMCNKCFKGFQTKYHRDRHLKICKEKNGKESSYMSLEEVAELGNTYEIPLKNVTIRRDGNTAEQSAAENPEVS